MAQNFSMEYSRQVKKDRGPNAEVRVLGVAGNVLRHRREHLHNRTQFEISVHLRPEFVTRVLRLQLCLAEGEQAHEKHRSGEDSQLDPPVPHPCLRLRS